MEIYRKDSFVLEDADIPNIQDIIDSEVGNGCDILNLMLMVGRYYFYYLMSMIQNFSMIRMVII